ncbi:asparaginase [Halomonas urumqiensis]|uniref:Asparaginase n=1 Tax=Halomonas urumqiensis TaxID=1684789 RepID=A0A2N7UCJ1_9GAMM|nr:asparaginase [Halomonas urumqiensis]PMR78163.1 asparaginase [Halomonas urumqiensis]PTB03312.1 asparaginase [Halomonas urumqiensis]GHE20525.1 L-asparaginase [Halomonas urumqiensis]
MTGRHIVVFTTGGTIASEQDVSGRSISGALHGEQLLDKVALPAGAALSVEVHSLFQKPSNAITSADLLEMHRQCQRVADREDVDGVVVTHGTDTLEETAYFLDITLSCDVPCVITGSQRAPHEPGTDAFRNLADALLTAAATAVRGFGVLVSFNQSLFAARDVRKVSSFQVDGFASPGAGPLGYVDGERVHLHSRPVPERRAIRPALPELLDDLPRVDLLPVYLDAAPTLVDLALKDGARGLVIEGLGRGHVPPGWVDRVASAVRAGFPVVVVSHCHRGPVHQSYEFPGSLASLEAAGAISLPDLSARKARLALASLLASPSREPLAKRLAALTA